MACHCIYISYRCQCFLYSCSLSSKDLKSSLNLNHGVVILQLLKRNEDINKLQNELEESRRELEILRDVLQKISKERDMLWEEVNKHREKNMLLISKVDELKSKIETLEEDILLKEGQITILKDTLTNKSIDLLASPKSSWESRVQ